MTSVFIFLYSSPASVFMYLCCFSCHLWSHRSITLFVIQGWIFFLWLPRTSSAVESSPSFRLLARLSPSLSRTQRAANILPTLAWNTSAIFRSLHFSRSNQMWGLYRRHFQLQLDGCKHEVMIAANVSTWERFVFAWLMLDLKHWGVRMKSVWLWTCPLGACKVPVLDNLWGWRVSARVKGWVSGSLRTPGVSILCRLSLQCQVFLPPLPSVCMHQGLLWHSNPLELQVYSEDFWTKILTFLTFPYFWYTVKAGTPKTKNLFFSLSTIFNIDHNGLSHLIQ